MDPNTHPSIYTPKNKTNLLVPVFFLITGVLFGLISQTDQYKQLIINITSLIQPSVNPYPSPTQSLLPTSATQRTVIGVLRTAGLSEKEKQNLGIDTGEYQITDLAESVNSQYARYFIVNTIDQANLMIGKCVQAQGEIRPEKTSFTDPSIANAFISLSSISLLDYSRCSPYQNLPTAKTPTQTTQIFFGTIERMDRAAFDIYYDYQIKLNEPYLDHENASGLPQTTLTLVVIPATNAIWQKIEENLGEKIQIVGTFEWGYAETKHFTIKELTAQN